MELVIIAAVSRNKVIGLEGRIPWHIPEDLKRFKRLTMGHPIIMGRRTYESIGRALPQRLNVVLSRQDNYHPESTFTFSSLDDAIESLKFQQPQIPNINYSVAFIIGGKRVYEEAIYKADRLEITHVHRDVQGDTYFPEIFLELWHRQSCEDKEGYSFATYVRK